MWCGNRVPFDGLSGWDSLGLKVLLLGIVSLFLRGGECHFPDHCLKGTPPGAMYVYSLLTALSKEVRRSVTERQMGWSRRPLLEHWRETYLTMAVY